MRVSTSTTSADRGYFSTPLPRVFAHRGLAVDAPENTPLAFAHALSAGVTHIETDVHVTADGVAVISHDPDLRRVAGRDVRVGQLTMAELRRVDLGHAQGFVSLAEALDGFPEARFNIDVKVAGAAHPTVKAVAAAGAVDRVLIASFDDDTRLRAVAGLPGVATSASTKAIVKAIGGLTLGRTAVLRRALLGVDAVQIPVSYGPLKLVTERNVRLLRAAGVEVHVWTINDAATMGRLLDLGVDGLVTDRADIALGLVRDRS